MFLVNVVDNGVGMMYCVGIFIIKVEEIKMKWISVEDRLPEGEVLAVNGKKGTYGYKAYLLGYVSHIKDNCYICENECEVLLNITHWMQLPKLPGSNDENK